MAHVSLHDSQRVVYALVPDKGPVSVRLTSGSPRALYEALKELRQQVDGLRPNRPQHPVLLDVSDASDPLPTANEFNGLSKAFAAVQFTVAGVLNSPRAEALSEVSDLLIQEGAVNATAAELEQLQLQVEEQIRLAQEAELWEEALGIDAQFNRDRHLAESAQVWDEAHEAALAFDWAAALVIDAQFNHDQEAAAWAEAIPANQAFDVARHLRESAQVWEQAQSDNAAFDALQRQLAAEREAALLKEEEALAWDKALIQNAAVDEARRQAEAARLAREQAQLEADWDEALAHNALLDKAELVACQARQAVMEGTAFPDSVRALLLSAGQVDLSVDAPLVEAVAEEAEDDQEVHDDGDVAVAVQAPVVVPGVGVARAPRPTKIFERRLRSGLQEYAEGCDLTIIGNVSSGAEAVADGHINVWGQVHGKLYAGAKGDTSARIICQAFAGEMVCIAGTYSLFEDVPRAILDQPVMFWLENQAIHYRVIEMPVLPA